MSENNEKDTRASRRKFIKAGAIAGGAAVVGLSLGLPSLTKGTTSISQTSANMGSTNIVHDTLDSSNVSGIFPSFNYRPQERWYFLYATDGVSWLPTDKFGFARRPVYMYGFTTPISWNQPYGFSAGNVGASGVGPPQLAHLRDAFADLNWIDPNSQQPIMRGKAMNIGPPIWGVEGDILDITMFNAGFAFGSCVTDPHTIHLHGVHAPSYYDGIPEISFGIPMWNPYTGVDANGCVILPGHGTTSFIPANDDNLTQGGPKGNVFTYRMYCERPGTYLYHCHVEASEHVHMGMYGPLWIYPKSYGTAPKGGAAYNNNLTEFSQEALLLLSDIDTRWHDSILNMADRTNVTGEPDPYTFVPTALTDPSMDPGVASAIANFTIPDYHPNFWTINGRCLPDTLYAGKWNQGYQPGLLFAGSASTGTVLNNPAHQLTYYGPVAGITGLTKATGAPTTWKGVSSTAVFFPPRQPIQTYVVGSVTEKILVRLHNAGFQAQPMHFHGVMPNIVGKDTFAWVPQPNSMFSTTYDERKRMYTIGVFSGENYDAIVSYPDKAAINHAVYGFINGTSKDPMPYSTSEVGVTPLSDAPFNLPQADYGDVVPVIDSSIPMILGPGAINPATGAPINTSAIGLPSASGTGTATGFAKTGYPLLYLWHVHDDYKVTNNGDYPGGAVVLVKILQQGSTKPTNSIPVNRISR